MELSSLLRAIYDRDDMPNEYALRYCHHAIDAHEMVDLERDWVEDEIANIRLLVDGLGEELIEHSGLAGIHENVWSATRSLCMAAEVAMDVAVRFNEYRGARLACRWEDAKRRAGIVGGDHVPMPEWKHVAKQFEALGEQDRAAFVRWLHDHDGDVNRERDDG